VVYSVRSERLLMEQLDYNLLFRWFVGLNIDDPAWDHSTFSFNRERLFDEEVAQQFFDNTVLVAQLKQLTSNEHFSVDGTLLEAWASHKSFRPKDDDGGDDDDFRGRSRSNETHESTTAQHCSNHISGCRVYQVEQFQSFGLLAFTLQTIGVSRVAKTRSIQSASRCMAGSRRFCQMARFASRPVERGPQHLPVARRAGYSRDVSASAIPSLTKAHDQPSQLLRP
jgi:hypothetical protein